MFHDEQKKIISIFVHKYSQFFDFESIYTL